MRKIIRIHDVVEAGELHFSDANFANVPVNIEVRALDREDIRDTDVDARYNWLAEASNFMPRKGFAPDTYRAYSVDRETLVEYVQRYTLPLYEAAAERVRKLGVADDDGYSALYYWS